MDLIKEYLKVNQEKIDYGIWIKHIFIPYRKMNIKKVQKTYIRHQRSEYDGLSAYSVRGYSEDIGIRLELEATKNSHERINMTLELGIDKAFVLLKESGKNNEMRELFEKAYKDVLENEEIETRMDLQIVREEIKDLSPYYSYHLQFSTEYNTETNGYDYVF